MPRPRETFVDAVVKMSGVRVQLSVALVAVRSIAICEPLFDGLAIIGIAGLTFRRWSQIGSYPPGLDGAQWLAIGRGFHGLGRSAKGVYAPLVPVLATVAELFLRPLPTLRLLAIVSTLVVGVAVWLVARTVLGQVWGLVAAAVVVPASALAEPVFYGGYPQQFAFAAGIVALGAASRYLESGNASLLWIVGLTSAVAAAAHHLYFALMILSLACATLAWLSLRENRARWRRIKPLLLALLPACVLSAAIAYQFAVAGYSAPMSASVRSSSETWQYATREAPLIWILFSLLGVMTLAVTWKKRGEAAWLLSVALIVPWGVLLVAFGQARLAPPLLVCVAIAVASGARALTRHVIPATALMPAALLFTLVLGVFADRAAIGFADFYRVVDASLIQAAAAIEADSEPGAVAVREDHRGWPIGWWFEALQTKPVYTGSDSRWLGFPDEQLRARQSASLFDSNLDATTFEKRSHELDVRYLVIPKWDWIGWDRWLHDPEFPVVVIFDDDHYLVLRVTG